MSRCRLSSVHAPTLKGHPSKLQDAPVPGFSPLRAAECLSYNRCMSFPETRMRRLRRSESLRALVRETTLDPGDLIYPLFICPGEGVRKAGGIDARGVQPLGR